MLPSANPNAQDLIRLAGIGIYRLSDRPNIISNMISNLCFLIGILIGFSILGYQLFIPKASLSSSPQTPGYSHKNILPQPPSSTTISSTRYDHYSRTFIHS